MIFLKKIYRKNIIIINVYKMYPKLQNDQHSALGSTQYFL